MLLLLQKQTFSLQWKPWNTSTLGLSHNIYRYNNFSSNSPCNLLLHHAIPGHNLRLLSNFIDHIKPCCKGRIDQCPSVLGILHEWTVIIQFKLLLYQPSLSLCQMICLILTFTTPPIQQLSGSNLVILPFELIAMKNKTCTCDYLDWIIVHDIPFRFMTVIISPSSPGLGLFFNFF